VWYVTLVNDQIYFYEHGCMHRFVLCTTPVLSTRGCVMVFNIIYMYKHTHTYVYFMCALLFVYVFFWNENQ